MLRKHRQLFAVLALMLSAVLLLAACGGGDDDDSGGGDSEPTQASEQQAEPTSPPASDSGQGEEEQPTEAPEATESSESEGGEGEATAEEPEATSGESGNEGEGGAETVEVLNIDAATTGGGGGQANSPLTDYCYVVSGGSMFEVRRMVDSRLFAFTADMSEYVPEIAESWEFEGNTLTFQLRENAKWHDGEDLTAEDVLFTFNLVAHPDTGSRYTSQFTNVVGFEDYQNGDADSLAGLTAPDDHTVQIEFSQPDSGILPVLPALDILPQHILGDTPPGEICQNSYWIENRIGAGPYKWGQLVEGQRIELEKFEDYFLGEPNIDEVNLLLFADAETSLAAFEQQSSLAAPLTASNLEYARGIEFARIETQSTGVLSLFVNANQEEFADPRVRQAMAYAIDQQAISESLFKGVAATPTWRTMPWLEWTKTDNLTEYQYDPERARELLEEAGWSSDEEYTLWYYYPDQVSASVVEAIQQYLGEVGINAVPRLDEGGARQQAIDEGTWALTYGAWGTNPPVNMANIWSCASGPPYEYCNEEVDELFQQARSTFDQEEQRQYYRQIIEILNQDLPFVWLFNRQNLVAVNQRLNTGEHGAWAAGNLSYHNFVEDWTIEEQ